MRPSVLYLTDTFEADIRRNLRYAHHRAALLESRAGHASLPARLQAAILTRLRRDHSLTDYACRLPDGSIGRVAVVQHGGEWTLLCRVARTS
jgi:hypothetical protein